MSRPTALHADKTHVTLPGVSTSLWTIPTIREAATLRARGMSYPDIAIAIEHFRGVKTTGEGVRYRLRRYAGVMPGRQHGSVIGLRRGAA